MRVAAFLIAAASLAAACSSKTAGPTSMEIYIDPERRWYQTEEPVKLVGFVTDHKGNLIDDAEVTWTFEPADAASVVEQSAVAATYTLHQQGQVHVTGCVAPKGPCQSLILQVDDGSPKLELTAPQPADELDAAVGVEVTGSVADGGLSHVFVDGVLTDVDELGKFSRVVPARFGVNHVEVVASDGVTPDSSVERDVVWAPRFAPAIGADGTPSIAIPDGLALSLGRPLFDDGAPLDLTPNPIVTSDLADILHLVLAKADLKSLIPDPVLDQSGVLLRIPAIDVGTVTTSMQLTPDGIDLFLRAELHLTTTGHLAIDTTTVSLDGGITAHVAGTVHVVVSKQAETPAQVTVTSTQLALESAESAFTSDDANAIFALAQGLLRKTIEQKLIGAVGQKLGDAVPGVLKGVLDALDGALANKQIVIDKAPFPVPVTLQLDGRLRTVAPHAGVDLSAVLGARVGTTSTATHPSHRGVALTEAVDGPPPFFHERPLQLAIRMSFVNSILYALWDSGLLEIDLKNLGGGTDVLDHGLMSAKLAPHLRAPRPGEPGPFVLSLGQIELDLQLKDGSKARFGCGLDVDVTLGITDNALAVTAGDPRIRMWTIVGSDNALLKPEVIRSLLLDQWPNIRDAITHALKLQLPLPSLGDLGGLAPAMKDFKLSFALAEPPYAESGYLMIDGKLAGTLAQP